MKTMAQASLISDLTSKRKVNNIMMFRCVYKRKTIGMLNFICKLYSPARERLRDKIFVPVVLLLALAGLMGEVQSAGAVNPEISARVRVFQEADITLYPGEYCYGSGNPAAIHASAGFLSMAGLGKRVGMPQTDDIPGAYNEYVIPAGRPMTVTLQWQAEKNDVKASCGPIASTFYPQPGRDYDITIGYAVNCFVQIRELFETSPGKASARQAPAGSSFSCARN
jgi:hypothetical protein